MILFKWKSLVGGIGTVLDIWFENDCIASTKAVDDSKQKDVTHLHEFFIFKNNCHNNHLL